METNSLNIYFHIISTFCRKAIPNKSGKQIFPIFPLWGRPISFAFVDPCFRHHVVPCPFACARTLCSAFNVGRCTATASSCICCLRCVFDTAKSDRGLKGIAARGRSGSSLFLLFSFFVFCTRMGNFLFIIVVWGLLCARFVYSHFLMLFVLLLVTKMLTT